jgi:hypothetical protein
VLEVEEAIEPHSEGRLPGIPELPKDGVALVPNAGAPKVGPWAAAVFVVEGAVPNVEDPNVGLLLGTALVTVGVPHGDALFPRPDAVPKAPPVLGAGNEGPPKAVPAGFENPPKAEAGFKGVRNVD